jgi:hypothetical protein
MDALAAVGMSGGRFLFGPARFRSRLSAQRLPPILAKKLRLVTRNPFKAATAPAGSAMNAT